MKKIFSIGLGLSFVVAAFIFGSFATYPVITEITPIPNPSITTTPIYGFFSTQAGTIAYGGNCREGDNTVAQVGYNTFKYNLTDGVTYTNCSVQVVTGSGVGSNVLRMNAFTVDVPTNPTLPVLTEVTPIPNPSLTVTPNYVFHSTQDGVLIYGGDCGNGDLVNGVTGNNTTTYTLQDEHIYPACTVQLTNTNGASNVLTMASFAVNVPELTPVIAQVTPIPNPSTTTTPSYVFSSTQGGTISYGGACGNAMPSSAIVGNNTVTYSLVDGQTYTNCTINVTNANGTSNTLYVNNFTIDVPSVAPAIAQVTPIPNPSTTTTPSYVFSSTQGGTISYGGACGNATPSSAIVGNNIVTYSLVDGQTYTNCTINVINANGTSNTLYVNNFTVDIPNPPVITEVTPIPNPSLTVTPSYTFNSTQAGTITYGGSCGNGSVANATIGNNSVIYSLNDQQTYSNCTITVTNVSNEVSNVLNLGTFFVDVPVGPNPPVLTEITPVPNPSTVTTPSYTFHSTQGGTISYGGACGNGNVANAVAGNNSVIYSLNDQQTYSDCTISVTNVSNETSNTLYLGTFFIDVPVGPNPPVLLEVTPIPNPSTVTTPSYVFNSTQPGTITYGGSCANGDIANAIAGNNTVVYSLTDGQTYNDCTISVTNASNEVSNVLNLGTFLVDVPVGPNPPVLVEVTAIPDPSSTITPSYVFNSTQAGTMTYGGSCGNGDVANAIAGNNTVIYSLTDGQTYNDCTITVTNVSNEVSNVLTLGAFTVTVTPTPNPNPPVVSSGGGGSGKAGMRFSGQRRDDYARSGKFWDMSKSIADVERINQGYLGRVTTYINRNGFRVFAGYLPGRLSLDYLSSRIQRSHKFVYRGERASRSGNQRRATKRQWETHPQTYFRNRWAHNAFFGIDKAVAFDPKEDAMKVQGGNTWTRPQWRRGGVWARDHVSINSNANPNKVVTPLPVYLPRLSINVKKQLPTSLGVRRVNLQYTVAKGVSRMRPVRIESAASNAYEMYVTDFKEPWANDRFFNRRETLEMYPGDGTSGQRTIRIERTLNPAYGAIIETSQEAWERSFLTPEKAPQNSFGRVNPEFIREDSYTNRVPTINDKTGRRYDTEVERWRAYRIQKSERINQWEVRPYSQYQEERGVDRTNG